MKTTILIIEDDPLNIKMISAYLQNNEYSIITACDGKTGIQKAMEEKPDLILLDILMPRLNGFETCKILKETSELENVPVIFLTALAESSSIKKAFEVGAVDFVSKPIEFTALLARIKTHLRLSKMNEVLELEVHTKTNELQIANISLTKLLKDREVLIKELYHRTKNNMMVISSMLSLHSNYMENNELSGILLEVSNKVQSMALVHKKLYQSSDMTSVDMHEYIYDLIDLISSSYEFNPEQIKFEIDVDEICVSIDTAVTCGLVINELLSNSFKYAFPDNKNGIITIKMKLFNNNEISIQIADTGIGAPDKDPLSMKDTLGLRTVIGIVENQLQGEIKFNTIKGMSCEILFPNNN